MNVPVYWLCTVCKNGRGSAPHTVRKAKLKSMYNFQVNRQNSNTFQRKYRRSSFWPWDGKEPLNRTNPAFMCGKH